MQVMNLNLSLKDQDIASYELVVQQLFLINDLDTIFDHQQYLI